MGELFGTMTAKGELAPTPSVTPTTLTGSPAAWAKIVGVSAMSPRSTDPPTSAAMTGGPPMKFDQLTLYDAPCSVLVALTMVWYSFS